MLGVRTARTHAKQTVLQSQKFLSSNYIVVRFVRGLTRIRRPHRPP
jgi:hypothetical protein